MKSRFLFLGLPGLRRSQSHTPTKCSQTSCPQLGPPASRLPLRRQPLPPPGRREPQRNENLPPSPPYTSFLEHSAWYPGLRTGFLDRPEHSRSLTQRILEPTHGSSRTQLKKIPEPILGRANTQCQEIWGLTSALKNILDRFLGY